MELVRIKHYVEKSINGLPAFVLESDNGLDYIFHGGAFVEDTEDNRDKLVRKFGHKRELDELFKADSIETNDLVDAEGMIEACIELTEVYEKLRNASESLEGGFRNAESMFNHQDYPIDNIIKLNLLRRFSILQSISESARITPPLPAGNKWMWLSTPL